MIFGTVTSLVHSRKPEKVHFSSLLVSLSSSTSGQRRLKLFYQQERGPILPAIILVLWRGVDTEERQFIESTAVSLSPGRRMEDETI